MTDEMQAQATEQIAAVTMEQDEKARPRSFRLTDQVYDKIRSAAQAAGYENQSLALSAMLQAWETEQARTANPGRAADIDSYQGLLDQLSAAYMHSLDLGSQAEARIRKEYDDRLTQARIANDTLAAKIKVQNEIVARQAEELEQSRSAAAKATQLEKELDAARQNLTESQKKLADLGVEYATKFAAAMEAIEEGKKKRNVEENGAKEERTGQK